MIGTPEVERQEAVLYMQLYPASIKDLKIEVQIEAVANTSGPQGANIP